MPASTRGERTRDGDECGSSNHTAVPPRTSRSARMIEEATRGSAFAKIRALFPDTVIRRRAAKAHAECARTGRHHRTCVRAVPLRGLTAPATQRKAAIAEQRVGQRRQPCRYVVQRIVDTRRRQPKRS